MATTVFNYDGSVRTTIADSSLDNTTNLQFPGFNYQGYGSAICSDLNMLLENFSSNDAPTKPVIGQLWFRPMYKDTSGNSYEYNRLLVYTGQTDADSLNPQDPNNIVPTGWVDIGTKIYTNISGPITKEIGDIWIYDQKQVYWNGTSWAQLGGAFISQTPPTYVDGVSPPLPGTTWYMLPEGLLWVYDNTISQPEPTFYRNDGTLLTGSWKLIGPSSPSDVKTGSYWTQVPDTSGTLHNVFVNQVDGQIISVNSSTDFKMDTTSARALQNFSTYGNKEEPDSPNEIHKGININQYYGFTLDGTATNSLFLNGFSQEDFLGRGFNVAGIESPTTPYIDIVTDLGSATYRWNNVYSNKFVGHSYSPNMTITDIGFPWPSSTSIDFCGVALGSQYSIHANLSDTSSAWTQPTTVDVTGDITANEISINANEKLTFTTSISDAGYNNIAIKLLPNGKYVLHTEYDTEVASLQNQIDDIDTIIGKASGTGETVFGDINTIKEEIGNKSDTGDISIYGELNDHSQHLSTLDTTTANQQKQITAITPGRLITMPPVTYGIPGSYAYTVPDGVNWLHVRGCGGGGSGGAGLKDSNTSQIGQSAAGGGGAAACAEFWVDVSKLTSKTFNISVAAGGVPNVYGQGGKGGDSAFGQWITLGGGYGGAVGHQSSAGVSISPGGAGGQFSVFDQTPLTFVFQKFGQCADYAFVINGAAFPSVGADTPWGSGGYEVEHAAGNGATGYGAGGSGGGGGPEGSEPGGEGRPGMWTIAGYS